MKASTNNALETFLHTKLTYIQTIINKTILSIKNNLHIKLFSDNDKNQSITILIELYQKTTDIQNELHVHKKKKKPKF